MHKSLIIAGAAAFAFAAPAVACTDISSKNVKMTGCVDEQWQAQTNASGALEFAYLTADQNYALQIVTESTVLAAQQLHDAIIKNAVAAVGKEENVKVISERVENIDGKPFNELEYTLTDGSNSLTYQNFYYSQPGFGTIQILGLSTPDTASAAAFKLGQFVATVKLGG